jgi:hypothetical protein
MIDFQFPELTADQIELVFAKLNHIDPVYLPSKNSGPFRLLALLVLNERVEKDAALLALGDDPRSPLQRLRCEDFGYWCIHNAGQKKAVYQLDHRHLTGRLEDDVKARQDARLSYAERSAKQAVSGSERLSRALLELQECQSAQLNLRL